MRLKPKKEVGSSDQNGDFEKSPDMLALDRLTRDVLRVKRADGSANTTEPKPPPGMVTETAT